MRRRYRLLQPTRTPHLNKEGQSSVVTAFRLYHKLRGSRRTLRRTPRDKSGGSLVREAPREPRQARVKMAVVRKTRPLVLSPTDLLRTSTEGAPSHPK